MLRACIRILGVHDGLFFCDLDNRSKMSGVVWKDGYFLCGRKFLQHRKMLLEYPPQTQKLRLAGLVEAGVVSLKMKGVPARRWVKIKWNVMLQKIAAYLRRCEIQSVQKCTPLPVQKCTGEVIEETYTVSSIKKKGKRAAGAAPPAPCPPDAGNTTSKESTVPDLNPLFKSALTKPSTTKTVPTAFDKQVADTLRRFAAERGWRVSPRVKLWADQVRMLRQDENGPAPQVIVETLARYMTAFAAGKTKFKVATCKELRDQWDVVERIAAKVGAPASARAVEVARLSGTEYKWPAVVNKDDLAAFAQKVITFAEHTGDRLRKLKKELEEKKPKTADDRVLLIAVGAVHVPLAGADGYAVRYLKRVRDEVRKWKDWSGNLDVYAPALGNKAAGLRKAAGAAGVSDRTWTLLKERLK